MLGNDLIFLRALEDDDLEFLYTLENDAAGWSVSDTVAPVSRHLLRQYLAHAAADLHEVRQLRLVIGSQRTGRAVGTLDLFDFHPVHRRAGVGILVLAEARRQGYARAALAMLAVYARQVLHLHQLHCTIAADNAASLRLFAAAGYQPVGVRRQWLRTPTGWQDAHEMQLVLG